MKVITKLLSLFLLLFFSSSLNLIFADFEEALDNYENGNYEKAYSQFKNIAEVGNAGAIYNIGVMHYQGQFIKKNYVKAYAWMKLANSFDSQYSTINAKNKLTIDQSIEADALYTQLSEIYSFESYKSNLKPFICTKNDIQSSNSSDYVAIKKIEPKAPSTARRKQANGYINVGYSIDRLGNVVDVDLLDEFPRGVGYAVETQRAVKNFKYPPFEVAENEVPLRYATYNIGFTVEKWTKAHTEHSKASVAKFIEMSNANNSRAQYLMATAVPSLYNAKIDWKKRNELLELSAKNGYHQAQLILGLRLIDYKKCKSSKPKGENWIKQAAKNGNEIAKKYIKNYIDFSESE